MNDLGLEVQNATNVLFDAFADQMRTFVAACDDLDRWGRSMALANLVVMGYQPGHDVILDKYLSRARRMKLSPGPAFRSLLATLMSPERADLLASLCETWGTQRRLAEREGRGLPELGAIELDPDLETRVLMWLESGAEPS